LLFHFGQSLQHNSLIVWLNATAWTTAVTEVVDYFSMFVLVGSAAIVDLRVLGVAVRNQSASLPGGNAVPLDVGGVGAVGRSNHRGGGSSWSYRGGIKADVECFFIGLGIQRYLGSRMEHLLPSLGHRLQTGGFALAIARSDWPIPMSKRLICGLILVDRDQRRA
jgi:hypothetical protein